MRHFKEEVIEAIPFHEQLIERHQKKLDTITSLMPKKTYKRLAGISIHTAGTPEYFVYDKENKSFFFVSEGLDETKKKWIKKAKRLTETIVL
jgi:hypothetical protein